MKRGVPTLRDLMLVYQILKGSVAGFQTEPQPSKVNIEMSIGRIIAVNKRKVKSLNTQTLTDEEKRTIRAPVAAVT